MANLLIPGAMAFAQQEPLEIPGVNIDVVSTTPLPGVDLPRNDIAAPVQTATGDDIRDSGALDLAGFLNRRLTGIHVNEIQGNPFQSDVNYRGYSASPLLGTPQGLSVYMDGVRLNQPFGEVVSWDLIPRVAISSTTLMPGSNPVFGLNTLGGAVSVHTKDGRDHQGGSLFAMYGSHVRRAAELEYGGSNERGWHWYFAGNRFGEHGWREDSHTDVRQAFAKVGRDGAKNSVTASLALANNSMNGSALQEQTFLERNYSSIYTRPDNTLNRSLLLNLSGRRWLSSKATLSGNFYYRDIHTRTLNADINEESLDQSLYQPSLEEQDALTDAGYTGFPTSGATPANTPFPYWRCIANVLLNDEPGEKCNGLINRTRSIQRNFGITGQVTVFGTMGSHPNQLVAGGAYDRSDVNFRQSTQLGYLNPDRSVTGMDAFADGVSGGAIDGEPFDHRVLLNGVIHTWSVYAADTFTPDNAWRVTLSARFNRNTIHNSDGIDPGGGPGSLDGKHIFQRLNPALGVTYTPLEAVNLYFGYSEGSRAATSIELGCADPDQPCKLPNAMAGDPALDQVVTRSWETGIRSKAGAPLLWNLGYFLANNDNDILFVTSTQSGFGYFKNFGKTRRRGLEASLSSTLAFGVTLGAGYTFLDATYASRETVNGAGNSSNDEGFGLEGVIEISPGDPIPLIPRHMLKASLHYEPIRKFSFDADLTAVSSAPARGNENNLHQPDGVYYLGPGRSAGYGTVNAGVRYGISSKLELVARLDNIFNRRYASAAQLGSTGFTETGNFIARPFPSINGEFPVQQSTFFAPGAPRSYSFGTRIKF